MGITGAQPRTMFADNDRACEDVADFRLAFWRQMAQITAGLPEHPDFTTDANARNSACRNCLGHVV